MTTPRPRAKSDINITPLIDIVLVLLIVFIVLVPCLSPSLSVVVPQVIRRPDPNPDLPVVVTLDREGKLFLQREEVTPAALCDRLVPVVMLQPLGLRKIFLKVDGELPHQQAVNVLDQIRVASERARRETRARPGFQNEDGGDVKVAITLLKRNLQS
jgi:biopolymer transport protein ExbD